MIVFFIRRYPDIDHMVPIIFKLTQENIGPLIVLSLDPGYNIYKDPGVIVLRDKLNVKIDYVYNLHMPTFTHRFLSFLMCSHYRYSSWKIRLRKLIRERNLRFFLDFICQIFVDFIWTFFSKKIDKLKRKQFNSIWAEKFLKQIDAKILIFDWVGYHKLIIELILSAAKGLGIPTVSFPHGARVWTIESWEEEALPKRYSFDYVISPDQNSCKFFIKCGVSPEKNYILGNARFCPEWIEKRPKIYPREEFISKNHNNNLLKAVYMEGGISTLRDKKEMIDTFRKIHRLEFIDLIAKPKPRSNRLQIRELEFIPQIVTSASSYALCKWADVIIMAPSSIYLEALWQDKIFIYPKFLFKRITFFESMNVGWIVNSYEELEVALRKLNDNPQYKPYSDEVVKRLLIETVNGGINNRDVLAGYRDFILEKAKLRK